ncbi:MAG: universal stress protein [Rickettsiales bacterium]|nr:universal stress protein [Rickettsiales bacterium]
MVENSKILICINNPISAENAITYACLMAKKFGNVIELLTIIDNSANEYQSFFSIGKKISNDKRNDVELWLKKLSEDIYSKHKLHSVINIKEGKASDEIEKTIENNKNIKMLILPSSPESLSSGKFIPYLTEKILDKLHIPILIIPSSLTKTQISDLL